MQALNPTMWETETGVSSRIPRLHKEILSPEKKEEEEEEEGKRKLKREKEETEPTILGLPQGLPARFLLLASVQSKPRLPQRATPPTAHHAPTACLPTVATSVFTVGSLAFVMLAVLSWELSA